MKPLCITYTILLIFPLTFVSGDEVLGCGGFIKSHVPIDFSKIEVKLITKQGIVKDKTTCAPNNGYYFVPLYDKGEFKLEISGPPGWSFTPKEVNLNINGKDPCSEGKDINFLFKGFGITGRVESFGDIQRGPQGVAVKLTSKDGERTTETGADGSFSFTPVYPGTYSVKISHPKWKLMKDSVTVTVTEGNTELPVNSLIIQGYEVKGKVLTADQNPVENTIIVLYAQKSTGQQIPTAGCETNGIIELSKNDLFICYVKTGSTGEFNFPVVPIGSYFVAPYYKEKNIDYQPDKKEFFVQHANVEMNQHFQVIGFTLPGRVFSHKNEPITDAKIYLNGVQVTTTDNMGQYKLEKLKTGKYQLKAEAENMLFDEITFNIETSLSTLPDLVPSAYKVCGRVINEKPQRIIFTKIGSSSLIETVSDELQEFCEFLPPGQYEVSVRVNSEDIKNGLQFFPVVQKIEVFSTNVRELVFSKLKSTIFGTVKCLRKEDCDDLTVTLKSNSKKRKIIVKNSNYVETDIQPGVYEVEISDEKLCWEKSKLTVNVNAEKVEVPEFVQTGYKINFIATHETTVSYKSLKDNRPQKIYVSKGSTTACLDTAGQYLLSINSCHEFEFDTLTYDTSGDNNLIQLNAQKHVVDLSIEADRDHGPIQVHVESETDQFNQLSNFEVGNYGIKLMLKPGEIATLTPRSEKLFFSPVTAKIEGTPDCHNYGHKFKAILGLVFEGKVNPTLEGVKVTVKNLNTNEEYTQETDSNGNYKFIPLDSRYKYSIAAEKESYILVGPEKNGDFTAQKLAEIKVRVIDEADKSPLQGVLLSLSGGESFRKNLQTNNKGEVVFHSLSSGDYFLRPMMKEYSFEPASQILGVKEGQTINVSLLGKRVAFSAFGKITTVNGDPVEKINVVAQGIENCTGLSEEATTDSMGSFRIRGLQPYCSFKVAIHASDRNLVQGTSPRCIEIPNIKEDIKDANIIIFKPILVTDVLLKVFTEKVENYKYLKVVVYRETGGQAVIYSATIDSLNIKIEGNKNVGLLVHLPSLPLDGNDYSVHLESTHHIKGTSDIVYFKANSGFKFVEVTFKSKLHAKEQPIKQFSLLSILSILMGLVLFYNIEPILGILKQHLNFNIDSISSYFPLLSLPSPVEYEDIDQIVQDINNVRKHKPKKTN
ncbi:nodal modulator 2 [Anthonomus grandis grandis]|uniref:nodal modulator 2 n=1 Tax=Anthonomus grandis grandis TaxID=2921223 RepID=UPI002165A6E3|nr:nodal modulator 2 [Anthonomus grandis grandis]